MNQKQKPNEKQRHWRPFSVEEIKAPFSNALATGPFGSSIGSRFFRSEGVPVIRGANLSDDSLITLDHQDLVFISQEKAREFKRSAVRSGDLIFTCWGTINQVGLIEDDAIYNEYIISNKQMKLTPDKNKADSRFLYYLFSGPEIQNRLKNHGIGSSVPGFNLGQLRTMRLKLPSTEEQGAIAAALSDADGLLKALDTLIAKKIAIKQAVMEELLSGSIRLPGFNGKWDKYKLGEIGTFWKGRGIKRDDVSDDGLACIRYGEIYTRYNDCLVSSFSRIPASVAATALPIQHGDLLFAGSGETAEEIGKCVAYLGEEVAYAGGDIVVLRPQGHNSLFLGHLMNLTTIAKQKARLGQGDAVVHISAGNLAQVEVNLPLLDEQTAIASIFFDMDTEIEALEKRRDKILAIKQGMMQGLLTGRTRLVKPEATN